MMAVPHVHLWPKEAVSNEEAIESSRACHWTCLLWLWGYRHVCSTCETETEIQTEEDVPLGNLSQGVHYLQQEQQLLLRRGHLGTGEMD